MPFREDPKNRKITIMVNTAVVDPGFPLGGAHLVESANYRRGYVSQNLYVKTKESVLLGWRAPGAPPGSATV